MGIYYISTNKGKCASVIEQAQEKNIDVKCMALEIEELEIEDVGIVSLDKAHKAYEQIKEPCFVEDSGFYIDAYPGKKNFPGTLVKRSGISTNIENLLETMKDVKNRNCRFISCVTYYEDGYYKQFFSISEGVLTTEIRGNLNEKARSRLWEVFIPKGYQKTLAEMTDEERKKRRQTEEKSAFSQFLDWYQQNKMNTIKQKCKVNKM